MDQRQEFVRLALQEGAKRRELCRRFGISPAVGYKWLARWAAGDPELADRSRRPHSSPGRSDAAIEAAVLAVRGAHPAWGARKILHCLARQRGAAPAHSTVHAILVRHGRVAPPAGAPGQAFRGERVAVRPRGPDGHYGVFFGAHQIASIDLTATKSVSDVSEQVSAMSPG